MNTALSSLGWAKQTAKGSAATEPDFFIGVEGGKMVDFSIDQKPIEDTSGQGALTGEYREAVAVGADATVFMRPKTVGSLLHAVLGTVQTTGTNPYTHVITKGDTLPYYTLFGKLDTEFRTGADCKVDELTIEWDGNKPVKVTATWAGCTPGYDTAFVPVTDERLIAPFTGVHGVYRYDVDGTTLAAVKTKSGKITIKRNLSSDPVSGTLTADDVEEGLFEAEVELKIKAATLADHRTLVTGTSSGSTVSESVIYGSFDVAWTSGADSVTIAATRTPFTCETPEADPKGGPVELTLKAGIYVPTAGGTPITATVVNGHASY